MDFYQTYIYNWFELGMGSRAMWNELEARLFERFLRQEALHTEEYYYIRVRNSESVWLGKQSLLQRAESPFWLNAFLYDVQKSCLHDDFVALPLDLMTLVKLFREYRKIYHEI